MSLINDDVGTDQMFLSHPSRQWTQNFIKQIIESLRSLNWNICKDKNSHTVLRPNSYCEFEHENFNTKIVVNLVHNISDIPTDDIVITDVVTTDHRGPLVKLYPEIFGIYYTNFEYQHVMPTKKFNCFIHRADPFRQSWLYQLVRQDLLDHGYVSYWCHDRFSDRSPQEYFEFLYQQNNHLFQKEHSVIKEKIPFKNFDCSLEHAIIDSEKSLVIDTFFHTNNLISYSEKVWRAIQLPRPWLLFSSMHAVKYLRDWGFDVFDDHVDHTYDCHPDPIQRQCMILDQLKTDINYTPELMQQFKIRADKNQQLLLQNQQEWPNKYKKIILELTDIINNKSHYHVNKGLTC
jgi:hypothetical protein